MTPTRIVVLLMALLCSISSAMAQEAKDLMIAHEITISSAILGEERSILVSLPSNYDEGATTYPVLYLLDGKQNMMHVAGSIDVLSRTGQVPKIITVGIPSINRERDLTPSHMDGFNESGGGLKFLEFIENELMPFINKNYRTHDFQVMEGHSLGGTLAAYTILNRPEMFDAYIVMSPALWWNNEELTEQAKTIFQRSYPNPKAIYFGTGSEDGWGMRQELLRFVNVLDEKSPSGVTWGHREFEGEGHMSAPLLTNYFGLKMIFEDLQLPDETRESFSEEAFLRHEAFITTKYGTAASQTGESYVTLAFELMDNDRHAEAVTVLERNAVVYSSYPPSFGWLADAQEKSGNL